MAASKKTSGGTSKKTPTKKTTKKAAAKKAATGKTATKKASKAPAAPRKSPSKEPSTTQETSAGGPAKAPTKKTVRAKKASVRKKPAGAAATGPTVRIQYYRSAIGLDQKQKNIVRGLGLRRLNTVRELLDTPALRGMVAKVPHLVRILGE